LKLAGSLLRSDLPIVIINDESSPACQDIFASLESEYPVALCRHPLNMGKLVENG